MSNDYNDNAYANEIKNFINEFYDIVHYLDLCFDSGSMVFDGAIQFKNINLYDLFDKFKEGKQMPFFVKTHQQFTELEYSVIYEYDYKNPILENAKCKDKNGIKKIQNKRVIKFYPFTQNNKNFVFVKLETTPSLSWEHFEHFKEKAIHKAGKAIEKMEKAVKNLLQPTQSRPPPTFAENCGMFENECKRHLNTLKNTNNNLLEQLKKDNDYNGGRPYKIQNILNAIFLIKYYESKILEMSGYFKKTITGVLEPVVEPVPLKNVLNTFTVSNNDFQRIIEQIIPTFAKKIGNIYGDELYISNDFWKQAKKEMQTKSINTRLIKKKSIKRNDKKIKLYKGKYGGIYTIRKSKVSGKYYKYYMT